MHTLLLVASFLDRSAMSFEICNRKLGRGWGVRLCHFYCEVSLSLFPAPLFSNLSHLLAFQDPYFPGSRTILLVGSKGLMWMESHLYFLQLHQESHKVQYSVLYFSSSSPGSKLVRYADDIVLYRPINSPEDIRIIEETVITQGH